MHRPYVCSFINSQSTCIFQLTQRYKKSLNSFLIRCNIFILYLSTTTVVAVVVVVCMLKAYIYRYKINKGALSYVRPWNHARNVLAQIVEFHFRKSSSSSLSALLQYFRYTLTIAFWNLCTHKIPLILDYSFC